ncbi:MAG: 4Fe-4S dicluster domain-containing protein [Syntrophales bacterium]
MPEKIKLYDDSKCTACRGCQLACKQWNGLKAKQTVNSGSYQNPPGLQPNTYMLIRFQDVADDKGAVKWLFRKEACMHCTEAACVMACPTGALYYNNDFKIVGLNREKCIGCKNCVASCPFEVPKYDHETDKVYKCDMCESRIMNGLEPACVKACPTGALKWGDKADMMKIAAARVKELGESASVYGDKFVGGTHLMYVLQEKPSVYAELKQDPHVPYSVLAWKSWLKPLSLLAAGGVIGGSFLHYIIHGPKTPDEDDNQVNKAEGGK